MKPLTLFSAAILALTASAANAQGPLAGAVPTVKAEVYTVTDHIRFNEGSLPTKGGILLTNFGTQTCDPLNKEGKGYVVMLGKENKILIPANGALNAPKGMALKDECLFIADVGCVVAYNLKRPHEQPTARIPFPTEELFVNDIISLGDFLLISVTNTGHLYTIDVSDCEALHGIKPRLVATIPGANGLAEHEGTLYIASYDPNGNPGAENVIYSVDMATPGAKPVNLLGSRYGQYDGLAISPDGTRLYFSNWQNAEGKAEVGYIDLAAGKKNAITTLDLGVELQGPADICISDGYLFIPDLPASKLYIMAL